MELVAVCWGSKDVNTLTGKNYVFFEFFIRSIINTEIRRLALKG
jgi:hypothetical protein